mmetsp:Transcript_44631/g.105736  ORF Transcript_44631/g.105736 Transcript_44631/m.105736 type:complete len:243 (+) Transcript_44631:68-796(+)
MGMRECTYLFPVVFFLAIVGVVLADAYSATPIPYPPCKDIAPIHYHCSFNFSCRAGMPVNATCSVDNNVTCTGDRAFNVTHRCAYCYQLPADQHVCEAEEPCSSGVASPVLHRCFAASDVLCLPPRSFQKLATCDFTTGKSWRTTMILSVVLGGFGADRFYLGHMGWGTLKLFSFGGLGIWALTDALLVAIGYLRPADGSAFYDPHPPAPRPRVPAVASLPPAWHTSDTATCNRDAGTCGVT